MKNKIFTPIIIAMIVAFNLAATSIIIAKDYKIILNQKNLKTNNLIYLIK